jgi:capsular exopolysaccharide synthesis family protein
MNAGPSASGSSGEVSLSDLLLVLRRRWQVIITAIVVALVIASLYCILKTRRYEGVTVLGVSPEGANSLDLGDVTASLGGGGLGFDEKLETQIHILESRSLAWGVISELRLDKRGSFRGQRKYIVFGERPVPPDDIEKTDGKRRDELLMDFEKALNVASIARTQAVEIKFRDPDPEIASEVANRLASDYTQRVFMVRFDDTMKASTWLAGQMDQIKSDVQESEAKLAKFQKETGIFGANESDNLVLSKLDDLSKELTDAQADRFVKEAKYRVSLTSSPELIGTIVPDSVLPVLESQEVDLKNQLAQVTTQYGPKYWQVIQLKNQIAQLDKSMQKELSDIRERFYSDYQSSLGTENQLERALQGQKQEAYNLSDNLIQYGILKREAETGNDLYEDLLTKLKEAGVVASLKAPSVDVIDPATPPTKPAEPDIPLILALSIVLGLGLGIGMAVAAESLDNLIRTSDELEDLTGLSTYGMLPHIQRIRGKGEASPNASQSSVEDSSFACVSLQRPTSHPAEAFRTLRTSLLLATPGRPPKTFLITSAMPEDGKTTVSVNIAIVLVQWGARVLLVDGDLRRGSVGERLHLPQNFGLSGALTGAGNWRDAIVQMPELPSLSIIPSGPRPPNSAELLGSTQMNNMIDEWAAEYDHVIIDCAPCVAVTDSVLIAQRVDVVLLVTRLGHTYRSSLRRAAELLQSGRETVTGLVVNDVRATDQPYGYGYGYESRNYYYEE